MGFNTTIVLMNDALSSIAEEPELGPRLYDAVLRLVAKKGSVDVPARGFCNALTVVETHHADSLVPVLVGGNMAIVLDRWSNWDSKDPELDLLRNLAVKRGFRLVAWRKQ
jgi:hypothetical protein